MQESKTSKLLISHYNNFPKMEIQDMLKYIFQSSFGCEHMISSQDFATDYIKKDPDFSMKFLGDKARLPEKLRNKCLEIENMALRALLKPNLYYNQIVLF